MSKKGIIILLIVQIILYNLAILYTKPISEYYNIPDYSVKLVDTDSNQVKIFENTKKYGRKTITLKTTDDTKDNFVRWVIYGNYSSLSGSLTGTFFKFIPHSDIKVKAFFKKSNKIKTNNSLNSPATGE